MIPLWSSQRIEESPKVETKLPMNKLGGLIKSGCAAQRKAEPSRAGQTWSLLKPYGTLLNINKLWKLDSARKIKYGTDDARAEFPSQTEFSFIFKYLHGTRLEAVPEMSNKYQLRFYSRPPFVNYQALATCLFAGLFRSSTAALHFNMNCIV